MNPRPKDTVKQYYKDIVKTHRYLQYLWEHGIRLSCARARNDAVSRCQLTVSRDMLTTSADHRSALVLYFVSQRTAVQAFDLLARLRAKRVGTTVPLNTPLDGRSMPTMVLAFGCATSIP
jgi:hypothetical protein